MRFLIFGLRLNVLKDFASSVLKMFLNIVVSIGCTPGDLHPGIYTCHSPFTQANQKHKEASATGNPGRQRKKNNNKQKGLKTKFIGDVALMKISRGKKIFHGFVQYPKLNIFAFFLALGKFLAFSYILVFFPAICSYKKVLFKKESVKSRGHYVPWVQRATLVCWETSGNISAASWS